MRGLFAVGFLLVAAGVVLLAYGSLGQGNVSSGGFILIGPLPIVFGTGSNGGELALISVMVGIVMVFMLLVAIWRLRSLTGKGQKEIDK